MPNGGPRPDQSNLILDRLIGLHPKLIDLSLGRIALLLRRLGHPERKLAPVIHVAGTNGKGSTIAFMRAILEAGGHRVQTYISPHLVRFHERIRLTDGLIGEPELCQLLEECEQANRGLPITFFEITTAAAFLAFSRQSADALLLEVGLGGRYDATNVIDDPRVCAITPVSDDHHQFLGDSVIAIGAEKAGIIKPGVPVITGPQPAMVLAMIKDKAARAGAPVTAFGEDWHVERIDDRDFRYRDNKAEIRLPPPSLAGPHQLLNAGLAVASLRAFLGDKIDHGDIRAGVAQAQWPGRLQPVTEGALADLLPRGSELWLDGGHNPAAAEVLREFLDGRGAPHLIVGMMASKSIDDFLAPFKGFAVSLSAVPIPAEQNALAPSELAAAAQKAGIPARQADSVESALRAIAEGPSEGRPLTVLICGSLYLAGSVLNQMTGSITPSPPHPTASR